MFLTPLETLLMILAVALGTMLTRFIPFVLFPEHREVPSVVGYLGKVLPPAMMGLLVVYCFKQVSFVEVPFGLPELLATTAVIILYRWKNNVLLSIAGATLVYMILVQMVFI